ncbi:hypothetical protein PI95_026125 [Hassallia byssoidea VB512170]|uniref:Uncharacterized protein n=1 Tax=Hassallia byssoidea VB512170 TaxID=1304833 RepID=A0A846HGI2_9CYAN|nr:hypothetical protein [Hassalia byssoidea]NEU75939.1 hypothetical protein [Hassalia byssoidea VB512170]
MQPVVLQKFFEGMKTDPGVPASQSQRRTRVRVAVGIALFMPITQLTRSATNLNKARSAEWRSVAVCH